jgi:hypothetical protein
MLVLRGRWCLHSSSRLWRSALRLPLAHWLSLAATGCHGRLQTPTRTTPRQHGYTHDANSAARRAQAACRVPRSSGRAPQRECFGQRPCWRAVLLGRVRAGDSPPSALKPLSNASQAQGLSVRCQGQSLATARFKARGAAVPPVRRLPPTVSSPLPAATPSYARRRPTRCCPRPARVGPCLASPSPPASCWSSSLASWPGRARRRCPRCPRAPPTSRCACLPPPLIHRVHANPPAGPSPTKAVPSWASTRSSASSTSRSRSPRTSPASPSLATSST